MAEQKQMTASKADVVPSVTDTATGTGLVKTESRKEPSKAFSQEEVDRIIKERLQRERQSAEKKYADYDDLKKAATKLKKIEDANKSEADKKAELMKALEDQYAELQRQNARLAQEQVETLIKVAVITEATKRKFIDPGDSYRMIDLSTLTVEEGDVKGVEEALEALAKEKPYLLQAQSKMAPTNPGRGQETGETDAERRARLFGRGESPFGKHGGGVFMLNAKE